GTDRDFIALGSDSGNMVILKFKSDKNGFEVVQNEVYGKTGCRRAVPGQYLAKDPKGRAIMIAATEKQKLVYILDRDTNENLIISSPLEAHKSSTICFGVVGLDVEYENPLFASLEIVFSALEDLDIKPEERVAQKVVTFYELDLGLNTVTRKQLIEVDPNANMLTAVPGGEEGPGGCLVFSFNWVVYISE
ncbi:pre-mRNA-splicing factor rse1, partial [Bonamia ostreae]